MVERTFIYVDIELMNSRNYLEISKLLKSMSVMAFAWIFAMIGFRSGNNVSGKLDD